MSWVKRLTSGIHKTSAKFSRDLSHVFTRERIDATLLEDLSDLLISNDFGVPLTLEVIESLSNQTHQKLSGQVVKYALRDILAKKLTGAAQPFSIDPQQETCHIILIVGVNGAGKTTTIGKLGFQLKQKGHRVAFAACDTFRKAAVEQLGVWAERIQAPLYQGTPGMDPAAVAYQAIEKAKNENQDVLFIDTAGRLQNKVNLMAELDKIKRIVGQATPGAPHQTLLVLDATVGQNAHNQVEAFQTTTPLSGLILTKLDGTSKAGIIVPLYIRFGLPIIAVGIGESVNDLNIFDQEAYLNGLLETNL